MPAHDVAVYSPYSSAFYRQDESEERRRSGGGAELQAFTLAQELARRGLKVAHIVFPVEGATTSARSPTVIERTRHRGSGGLYGTTLEAAAIWRSLRRADARCYIVRGSGGHLPVAAHFCRAYRRRLVFSSSNDLDFDFSRPDRRPRVLSAYRKAIARADRIVVQTNTQLALAREAFPNVEARLIRSFAQPAERTTAEPRCLLWSDRLVEYKHPEAFLELAERLPDIPFRMSAPETSETSWYPELVEHVRRTSAELPNVELLPRLPRERMLEEIAAAAAVVKTSRVEGMPNTFLEAWARGVPVLSLHVDPDNVIADRGAGVFAEGSMERLAEAASAVWGDPDLRKRMGEQGRRFVTEFHGPDAVAGRWLAALLELLE